MSPAIQLCRRNCFQFNAFNTWTTYCWWQTAPQLQRQQRQQQQYLSTKATRRTTTISPLNKIYKEREDLTTTSSSSSLLSSPRDYQSSRNQSLMKMSSSAAAATPPPQPSDIFHGVVDRFRGITVDTKMLTLSDDEFATQLTKSLAFWEMNKNRAIWFRIYKEQANWVPILTAAGFDFHHAQTGVVTLYRWLPSDETNNLPKYAHTMLGVGGLVINDNNEILVVSERFALIPSSWKLPGGYVEPGENLIEAAMREVNEETGIETTFRSVVSIRHSHGGNFGCSDIYMVIALKPLNLNFKRCEREIAQLQWMPVHEYLKHPNVHETNRHFVCTYLDYEQRGLTITRTAEVHQYLKKEYNMYFVERQQQQQQQQQQQSQQQNDTS